MSKTLKRLLLAIATSAIVLLVAVRFPKTEAAFPLCDYFTGQQTHCYCDYFFLYSNICPLYCPSYCSSWGYNNHHCKGANCQCGRFPCKRQ